ncbi:MULTISPECIES: putative alpha/beta hydrolase [Mycobacterium]|nr:MULTISPECIES: alpha/beta hydrolase [Mycobacterium]
MQLRYISIPLLIAEAGGGPWAINQSLQLGRPAQISDLATAFHDAGRSTTEADTAFDQARRRFETSWNRENGAHPINDSPQVQGLTTSLRSQAARLPEIGLQLDNIAGGLAGAQRSATGQIVGLEAQLCDIDSEIGEVLALEHGAQLTTADRLALEAIVCALEDQAVGDTQSAVSKLHSIRAGYAGLLHQALTSLSADGFDPAAIQALDAPQSPAEPAEVIAIPAPTASAEEVKKWWDSLSPQQRGRLIDEHPPELGNLNGINAITRDLVNQAVMDDDITRVESVAMQRGVSADDIVNNPQKYGLSGSDVTRYRNAIRTRDGLIYDREHATDDPRPVMLWAYDPLAFNGEGKAAIAIGNPDYARNTAVIVPGTGSSVAQGWMSDHDDATNLYDQALAADPEHHYTAVIAWMGYDAPNGFSDVRVTEPGLARSGGALLANDVNGLWVTHNSLTPQHVTVIGHSYGSTTVADAFAGSGMHANDAILIGCPGTDLARSAADFHLDGGQVYVGSASTDPVSWIGESSGVPGELLKGKLREYGVPIPLDAGLGRDPAGDGFGSVRFHAEVPGSGTMDRHDHSHYYVMGSESLRSITDISSGHPDRLASDDLIAEGRRQPHVGPFRVPGVPAYIDPESDRPRDTVHDDHHYPAYQPPR